MGRNIDARELHSFDYQNVRLNDGLYKKQFEDTLAFCMAIRDEELLHTFREKAGLHAPGNTLAGWYGAGATTFGQLLGAFAKMYRSTGDARIKEKALYLSEEWAKCAEKARSVLDVDTYCFDKMLGGLLDLYEYAGYQKAIDYAEKLTARAVANFQRNIKRDGLQDKALSDARMIEWYTLPENLYRAYQLTGNKEYMSFADEWEYGYYWDKLLNNDQAIGPRHAYSHVNALSSAARAYKVKGDPKYLKIIENAYDMILSGHTYATGGYGPAESLFVETEGYLGDALMAPWDPPLGGRAYRTFTGETVTRDDAWGSCEVSCCAWAVFKICNYLMKYTGDAKYGDWAEKMLYNGVGGQLPLDKGGKVMYYASYFINGALKSTDDRRLMPHGEGFTWQCCTGTFPQDVAEYCNMLYYHNEESIYVSQYLPSTVQWEKDGRRIEIENLSRYPEENLLTFQVKSDGETAFQFKFRIPSWVKSEIDVRVNGKKMAVTTSPNTWRAVGRTWKNGDVVSVRFPFRLSLEPVDRKNRNIVALKYGPIVLATDEMTELIGDAEKPEEWIHPVDGKTMAFETDKGHVAGYDFLTRTFVPYYGIGPMTWYFMYNRIRVP
jgi:DUF1680 family protein